MTTKNEPPNYRSVEKCCFQCKNSKDNAYGSRICSKHEVYVTNDGLCDDYEAQNE